MKKISRQSDITDVISGDIDYVVLIEYYSHTNENITIIPQITKDDVEHELICRLSSAELSKLPEGQLCCKMYLAGEDSGYSDEEYNYENTEGLPIWLT